MSLWRKRRASWEPDGVLVRMRKVLGAPTPVPAKAHCRFVAPKDKPQPLPLHPQPDLERLYIECAALIEYLPNDWQPNPKEMN